MQGQGGGLEQRERVKKNKRKDREAQRESKRRRGEEKDSEQEFPLDIFLSATAFGCNGFKLELFELNI